MACCGGGKPSIRVQQVPSKHSSGGGVSTQNVRLTPPSALRVFVNNQKTGEHTTVESPQAVRREEAKKCPLCQHVMMTTRVGGRPRNQCTNFSCRHILP
jgi:hypothetical protein